MEAIAAFGLACNVIQVVSFGLEVSSKFKEVQQQGSTVEVQDLENTSNELATLTLGLDSSIKTAPAPLTKDDHDLQELSRKCFKAATDLQVELQKLSKRKGQKRGTLMKTFVTLIRGGAIQDLHTRLREYERVLNTRLLVGLSQRHDAHSVIQQHGFASLSQALQDFITKLAQGLIQISELVSLEHVSTRVLVQSEHVKTRAVVLSGLQSLRIEDTVLVDCQKFLRSLYFPEIDLRQETITDAHQHTFEWIFDESDETLKPWNNFVEWLKSGSAIYWVNGKAGSGKSTLMNFVCNDGRTQIYLKQWKTHEVVVLRFFFWKAGTTLQKSLSGLLRSLLYQLFHQDEDLLRSVLATRSDLKLKNFKVAWSTRRLEEIFEHAMDFMKKPICIFLDGLDEFGEEEGRLVTFVQSMNVKSNIKICTSSRPSRHLHSVFQGTPQLRLQDLTKNDMKLYVDDTLLRSVNLTDKSWRDDRDASRLTAEILEKAEGIFLWVHLALKAILRGLRQDDSWIELRTRLDVLPKGLEDLYSHMWSRHNEDEPIYRKQAALCFHLALLALKLGWNLHGGASAFEFMIACNPDDQAEILESETTPSLCPLLRKCETTKHRIPTLCAGLLEVRERNPTHETAEIFRPRYPAFEEVTSANQSLVWEELNLIHHSTIVLFIHRSAVDFLQETEHGEMILGAENVPNIDIFVQLLRATLATQMLHFASPSVMTIAEDLFTLRGLVEIWKHPSALLEYDVLGMIDTVYRRMISRSKIIQIPENWFSILRLERERKTPTHFENFLGFAIQGGISPSISKWALTRIEDGDDAYKSRLLASAISAWWYPAKRVKYDAIQLLLRKGASINAKYHLTAMRDLRGFAEAIDLWTFFLLMLVRPSIRLRDEEKASALAIIETFHCFLERGASLSEVTTVSFITDEGCYEPTAQIDDSISATKRSDTIVATFTPCFVLKEYLRGRGYDWDPIGPCCRRIVFYSSDGLWSRPENEDDSRSLMKLVSEHVISKCGFLDPRVPRSSGESVNAIRERLLPIEREDVIRYLGWDRGKSEAEQREFFRLFSQVPDSGTSGNEAGWETIDEELV